MRPTLVLLLGLAACSSKPVAPVITDVTAPPTASAGQTIDLLIRFEDPDSAVTGLHVVFPATGESVMKTFTPIYTSSTIDFGMKFPAATPLGPFEIDLSLIDATALEGPAKQVMVTIQ